MKVWTAHKSNSVGETMIFITKEAAMDWVADQCMLDMSHQEFYDNDIPEPGEFNYRDETIVSWYNKNREDTWVITQRSVYQLDARFELVEVEA